eukprot:2429865-Prymnesium_polylepis.3
MDDQRIARYAPAHQRCTLEEPKPLYAMQLEAGCLLGSGAEEDFVPLVKNRSGTKLSQLLDDLGGFRIGGENHEIPRQLSAIGIAHRQLSAVGIAHRQLSASNRIPACPGVPGRGPSPIHRNISGRVYSHLYAHNPTYPTLKASQTDD